MCLGAIGAVLAVLVLVFLVGRAWYAIVEGVLGGLRRLFGKKKANAWHPLPTEQEKGEKNDDRYGRDHEARPGGH